MWQVLDISKFQLTGMKFNNYDIDCKDDGIDEGSGITGSFTCEYADDGEHVIVIRGES